MYSFFIQVPFFLLTLLLPNTELGTLQIEIQNIEHATGNVHVGLYVEENFLDEEKVVRTVHKKVSQKGSTIISIENLPYGTYGFGIYHDVNTNKKCDKNFLGIPTEPFGISRNPTNKYSRPSFDQCKFVFDESHTFTSARLDYW